MGIRVLCEMPNDQLADIGLIVKNSRTLGFVVVCKAFRTGGVVLGSVELRTSSGLGVRFPSFPNEGLRVFSATPKKAAVNSLENNLERHSSKLCLTTRNSIVRHPRLCLSHPKPSLRFFPLPLQSCSPIVTR